MAKSRQELLEAIADATPSGGGNNCRDGRYRFIVRKTGFGDGFNGARWDIDLVVQYCAKIPVQELKEPKRILDIEPNAVGTDVGIVKMLTTDKPYAAPGLGDAKTFVLTLYGVEGEVDKKDLLMTLDELDRKNSGYGRAIDCVTRRKVSKENEIEMVLQDWSYVEQTQADIEANRKWVESLVLQVKVPAGPPAQIQNGFGPPAALGPPRV